MPAQPRSRRTALVIHGGAGVISRSSVSAEDELGVRAALDRALDAGHKVLADAGSALDAVAAAVVVLEDSPWFNAGMGSVFNAEGGHELDASIMEGHTRRAGAIAGVSTVSNPVLLARAVNSAAPLRPACRACVVTGPSTELSAPSGSWVTLPIGRSLLLSSTVPPIRPR